MPRGSENFIAQFEGRRLCNLTNLTPSLHNLTSLFSLQYLERLNLASNDFDVPQFPRRLCNLTNLTYLNLSEAGFSGQIPVEFIKLKRLVSLDLSNNFNVELDFRGLVQNLTELRELYLDGVNISDYGSDWSRALSPHLPNLKELSLCGCHGLSDHIYSFLSQIHSLSVIRLDYNGLTTVPHFFANFSNLTTLSLVQNNLSGHFPNQFFKVPTLQNLDLSFNLDLSGTLPQFPLHNSLRTLVLHSTNFSGSIPDSISNLAMLSRIDLSTCKFSGKIPSTMKNLAELVYVDLSYNNFTGLIPLFHMSKKLTHIDLYGNKLTGPLSSAHFEGLLNLEVIYLGQNLLTGNLPSNLFVLPSLHHLWLNNNEFEGEIKDFLDPVSLQLNWLDLSSNNLQGPIPWFFSKFEKLEYLSLSFNFFNGSFQLDMFRRCHNLAILDVSHNNLWGFDSSNSNSTFSVYLDKLDLSANELKGEIPAWIWDIATGNLNLSFNQLTGFQKPFNSNNLITLDLRSNQLQGQLPIPLPLSYYLDFSNNNLNNSIPPNIGNYLSIANFLSLSNNNFTGVIPTSICTALDLLVLDLSNNALNGSIPSCLTNSTAVLKLRRNRLSGNIPDAFPINCGLTTLDLSHNFLTGKFPGSLVNCQFLSVLDIGQNNVEDTFPCKLKNITLVVLILRSNRFHGDLYCPEAIQGWKYLQIIDISVNNFTGELSPSYFSNWKAIMNSKDDDQSGLEYLHFEFMKTNFIYRDTVIITIKGVEMELSKILVIFTSIDFSRNNFKGKIPDSIGDLKSLYLLNLSFNAFTDKIPASIGNLKQLGSLDLSMNHLTGKIPEELANVTFLSFLNLSFNKLSGSIPLGHQLQTFSADSFEENAGLCGIPLNISCNPNEVDGDPPPKSENWHVHGKTEIDWNYICASLGFATGLGIFVLPLLFCPKWRERYFDQVDEIILNFFPKPRGTNRRTQARIHRNQIRRL